MGFNFVGCSGLHQLLPRCHKSLAVFVVALALESMAYSLVTAMADVCCYPCLRVLLFPDWHTSCCLQDLDLSSDAFGIDLSCAEPLPSQIVSTLTSMTHLTSLDLSRRALTERQLHEILKKLPLLRSLTIHGVPICNEQVARLERHHPDVNVHKRNSVLETMPELATLLGSLSVT